MTNFEKLYNDVIKKSLVEKFGYKNPHEIPKLTKVVLNMGIGDAVTDKKKVTSAMEELALIAGQQPVMTKARKSIATTTRQGSISTTSASITATATTDSLSGARRQQAAAEPLPV